MIHQPDASSLHDPNSFDGPRERIMSNRRERRVDIARVVRGLPLATLGLIASVVTGGAAMLNEADQVPPGVADIIHVCSSCHGLRGHSTSSLFPRLARQQRDYIVMQLKAFRDHTRADPHAKAYMWGMAARLTDAQVVSIADYYAAQPPVRGEADPSLQAVAGAKIYTKGIPSSKVPACMNCHGKEAEGHGTSPRLAGQHSDYLARQMRWYASMARANQVMYETARRLTPEQIAAVAVYLARQ
jgi:cytochrome c553